MKEPELATPAPIYDERHNNELKIEKSFELNYNNDTYLLLIEKISEKKIKIKISQINNISFYYYENIFSYEEITKILLLEKNYYDNIDKIFKFYENSIKRQKVSLIIDQEKKIIKLSIKKVMDFDEVNCYMDLYEKKLTNEEMIIILFNKIKEMELKGNDSKITERKSNNNNNDLINNLIKKNEEMEKKLNLIIDENLKLKKSISNLENSLNELKSRHEFQKEEKEENNFKSQNISINFYENPENLSFKEYLTNNHSNSGWLREFAIYTSLYDNLDYLVYNNKNNYNLDILRIKDRKIIHYLKCHKTKVSVIRYFIQNKNNKEYLLSCDESRLTCCWDISTYTLIDSIYTNYSGYIWDALMLFNIFGKNYIFLPSNSSNEYTKIYEFKENLQFIRDISGTKENKTNYLIPWFFDNNYYLIECCSSKISINNILKDEIYANLKCEPEGLHCCGYIYNDNYLCVSDYNNNFVRIWDLINKTVYKEINYEGNLSYGIIPWNDVYSIIACSGYLVIIDLKQQKMAKSITLKKANLCGIKKIKLSKFGECLICSDTTNNIRLFNIQF